MNYLLITLTILFLAVSETGFAQVADTLDLGEVVITASKTPTTERETTKPVTVIDIEEIKRYSGSSLSELLNEQNGVLINGAVSSPGKDKSVYLRGASTQYTLILLDGFPVTDPSGEGGAFDLRLIPLENIERIEIVKGSMSTLYGSDAIAGVINIITRKPENGTFNLNGKASYGSYNTNELSLGANGRSGIVGYSLNLSREFTEGISEANPEGSSDFNKDGFERRSVNSQVSFLPVEGLSITPFLNYSEYDGDYDDGAFTDGDNTYEADLLNSGIRSKLDAGDVVFTQAATFTKTERKFTDSFGVFNPKATFFNSDLYATYNKFTNVRLLAGFNIQELNFELDNINEGSSILSPYVTTYLESGFGLNAELGIRLNSHSEYGSNWTYNIAPVYNLNEQVKLLASISSGFKVPTLNELFGPFGANTDLKPQKSLTFDTGVEFRSSDSRFSAGVIYFKRDIEDLISYDSNVGYININEQSDSGFEVTTSYRMSETQVELFYNYLDGAIIQNGEESDNLIRRPDHQVGGSIDQTFRERFQIGLSGQFVGKRTDLFYNSQTFTNDEVELDSYVLLDARFRYHFLDEKVTIFASLNNILNTNYTEVYGFNTRGTHFNAGLKFSY